MKPAGHTDYKSAANICIHMRDGKLCKVTVNRGKIFESGEKAQMMKFRAKVRHAYGHGKPLGVFRAVTVLRGKSQAPPLLFAPFSDQNLFNVADSLSTLTFLGFMCSGKSFA